MKKIFFEPKFILKDIFGFFLSSYKKPKSFLFNYIIPYQSIRVNIDRILTKLYQKKFLKLLKTKEKIIFLEEINDKGVLKIEKFFTFQNSNEIIELINNEKKNKKYLHELAQNLKKDIINEIIFYMSFVRGENYTQDQIRVFFICNNDINGNEDFHSDSFSHSPKGYIYLNQIDSQTRPFLYLSKSHKNYSDRIKLENLCGKKLYSGKNLFNHQSSRIKEYDQWKRYFDKHKLFVGLAKQGDFILADTAGFHAKGPGTKPRYALWIEPIRGNLLNKLIGILTLNNFFKKNNYSLN